MAPNLTTKTLDDIFGAGSQPHKKVQYLTDQCGAKVSTGLFNFKIELMAAVWSDTLPALVSKYASHPVQVQEIIRSKIMAVIEAAFIAANAGDKFHQPAEVQQDTTIHVPDTPPTSEWMKATPIPAKEKVAAAKAKTATPVADKPKPKDNDSKLVNSVIKLADARAVSQKVLGTSAGSVYRVAAIGKLNVAVRIQASGVSLRSEFQGVRDDSVVQKMVALGFSDHGKYQSMHLSLTGQSPTMRVIGSILLGAGLEFDSIATTVEQING